MTTTVELNLSALRAAAQCASTETTRYYLCGVCLEIHADKIIYVATDGHVLFTYRQETSTQHTMRGSYIIPTDVIKAAKPNRATPDLAHLTRIEDGNTVKLLLEIPGAAGLTFSPIDGTFPDWRHVVPKQINQAHWAHFNPSLLERFWKVAKLIGCQSPTLTQNGTSPAYVSFSDTNAFGVVMPMRGDEPPHAPPEWLRPDVTLAQAAA